MKRMATSIAIFVSSTIGFASGEPTLNEDLFAEIASQSENANGFAVTGSEKLGAELCIPVPRLPGIKYSKKDIKLCKYNFYDSEAENDNVLTAICPKMHSTSPAMEIYKFEDASTKKDIKDIKLLRQAKARFESTQCKKHSQQRSKKFMTGVRAKKLAKLKTSISCSYTPAILSYYQLSQIFGGVAGVPPSVIRTMDAKAHQRISRNGVNYINALPSKQRGWLNLNQMLWRQFSTLHSRKHRPSSLNRRARQDLKQIFTEDKNQIVGAMVKNPSGEHKLKTFSGSSVYVGRPQNAAKIAKTAPIHSLVSRRSKMDAVAEITEMKGVADLLLLDYILIQQDRQNNGNVHYVPKALWLSEDGSLDKENLKSKTLDKILSRSKPNISQFKKAAKDAVAKLMDKGDIPIGSEVAVVREIVAKDNDCGGSERKGTPNDKTTVKQVEAFSHLNMKTYLRLQWFASEVGNLRDYFKTTMFYTDYDFKIMKQRAQRIAKIFRDKCRRGRLHLDLSPKAFLKGERIDSRAFCDQKFEPQI